MVTSDPDPAKRWQAIVEFYVEFAARKHWDFLCPMVGLAEWVAAQPMAAKLYPGTSHEYLTVGLHPGYQPEQPFFSVGVRTGGEFAFELWSAVGRRVGSRACPETHAREVFSEFAARLEMMP